MRVDDRIRLFICSQTHARPLLERIRSFVSMEESGNVRIGIIDRRSVGGWRMHHVQVQLSFMSIGVVAVNTCHLCFTFLCLLCEAPSKYEFLPLAVRPSMSSGILIIAHTHSRRRVRFGGVRRSNAGRICICMSCSCSRRENRNVRRPSRAVQMESKPKMRPLISAHESESKWMEQLVQHRNGTQT